MMTLMEISLFFDSKRPSENGVTSPSMQAFIKKLDPNDGFRTVEYEWIDMTDI